MKLNIANIFCLLVVCICYNNGCDAFGLGGNSKMPVASTSSSTTSTTTVLSRQSFLANVVMAAVATTTTAVVASPTAVWAKEEVKKGSKDDPAVQAKMSVCVYECTKPKGSEQMTRVECLKKCKKECVTAKN